MFKFNSETLAKEEAAKRGLRYGWSVFSAGWYVGTLEKLEKIGVIQPNPCIPMPTTCSDDINNINQLLFDED